MKIFLAFLTLTRKSNNKTHYIIMLIVFNKSVIVYNVWVKEMLFTLWLRASCQCLTKAHQLACLLQLQQGLLWNMHLGSWLLKGCKLSRFSTLWERWVYKTSSEKSDSCPDIEWKQIQQPDCSQTGSVTPHLIKIMPAGTNVPRVS